MAEFSLRVVDAVATLSVAGEPRGLGTWRGNVPMPRSLAVRARLKPIAAVREAIGWVGMSATAHPR